MIRHVVLVKFRADVADAERREIFTALAALKDRVPGLLGTSFGPSVSPERLEQGFSWGFTMDFRDAAARDAYLVDEEHKRLGGRFVSLLEGGVAGLVVLDLEV